MRSEHITFVAHSRIQLRLRVTAGSELQKQPYASLISRKFCRSVPRPIKCRADILSIRKVREYCAKCCQQLSDIWSNVHHTFKATQHF